MSAFLTIVFVVGLDVSPFNPDLVPGRRRGWFGVGGEADLCSRYVWRGLQASDGAVLQPSLRVSVFGATLSGWGNLELEDTVARGEWDEARAGLGYSRDFGPVTLKPAATARFFLLDSTNTVEAALNATWLVDQIRLSTTQVVELSGHPGSYFGEFGVSYVVSFLRRMVKVEGQAKAGWGSASYNVAYVDSTLNRFALGGAGVGVSVEFRPIREVYVRPHLDFTTLPDQGVNRLVRHRPRLDEPDNFVFGAVVGAEF
jgi:hypothetical protein